MAKWVNSGKQNEGIITKVWTGHGKPRRNGEQPEPQKPFPSSGPKEQEMGWHMDRDAPPGENIG